MSARKRKERVDAGEVEGEADASVMSSEARRGGDHRKPRFRVHEAREIMAFANAILSRKLPACPSVENPAQAVLVVGLHEQGYRLAKEVRWGEASLGHHRQFFGATRAPSRDLDDMVAEGLSWREAFARLRDM